MIRGNEVPPKRTDITKEILQKLYVDEQLSKSEIGRRLNSSCSTISRYLKEHLIPERDLSTSSTIYPRFDFNGSDTEKAYFLGFRIGDLNVKYTSPHGRSIEVNSRTSSQDQAILFQSLFGQYGYPYAKRDNSGQFSLVCRVNLSFSFLLPKFDEVPDWITNSKEYSASFAAGYSDAEGSFYTFYYKTRNEWRSGFNIASQDENIIHWFYIWLQDIGATCPAPVKDERVAYNRPVWMIIVRKKASLLALIETLEPYLRHPKRRKDMERVRQNVIERKRN